MTCHRTITAFVAIALLAAATAAAVRRTRQTQQSVNLQQAQGRSRCRRSGNRSGTKRSSRTGSATGPPQIQRMKRVRIAMSKLVRTRTMRWPASCRKPDVGSCCLARIAHQGKTSVMTPSPIPLLSMPSRAIASMTDQFCLKRADASCMFKASTLTQHARRPPSFAI
jgi:hypothetical protein